MGHWTWGGLTLCWMALLPRASNLRLLTMWRSSFVSWVRCLLNLQALAGVFDHRLASLRNDKVLLQESGCCMLPMCGWL
jgi:hypothetical protein